MNGPAPLVNRHRCRVNGQLPPQFNRRFHAFVPAQITMMSNLVRTMAQSPTRRSVLISLGRETTRLSSAIQRPLPTTQWKPRSPTKTGDAKTMLASCVETISSSSRTHTASIMVTISSGWGMSPIDGVVLIHRLPPFLFQQDLTRLPPKEHLRLEQTRKLLAYLECTHAILSVTSPYSKCILPLWAICMFCSWTY